MLLSGGNGIGGAGAEAFAGVAISRLPFKDSAGVLPRLTTFVPMKTKLAKGGRDFPGLLLREMNPNPFPDDFGECQKVRCFVAEQFQKLFGGKLAVGVPACPVKSWQLVCRLPARAQLFGSALESLTLILRFRFHGLFFVLCCSSSVCRPSPQKDRGVRAARGRNPRRAPRSGPLMERAGEGDERDESGRGEHRGKRPENNQAS